MLTRYLFSWLVEPYVEHTNEFYVAIASAGAADEIYFSPAGGMEVEEQWGQVRSARVPVEAGVQLPEDLDAQLGLDRVPAGPLREGVARFLRGLYSVFVAQDFVSLEINPFTVDVEGRVLPLDLVAELDECAAYRHPADWERVEFPAPFGRRTVAEEERVAELDAKTGASLKLTVLNPHARLWLMVAGGGASVIFADTVADLGYGADLGNYGEYSGNPNEEETAAYARCVLALATRPHPDAPPNERRALLIGGGIANFTDVAKTFKGIVRAIEEYQDAIRRCRMKIFVRRAGPNYQTVRADSSSSLSLSSLLSLLSFFLSVSRSHRTPHHIHTHSLSSLFAPLVPSSEVDSQGLRMMRDLGRRLGLDIEVYGPEHVMTSIIPRAIEYIQQP
jgi:ATP citrate (pro-S)-lyase